MLFSTSLPQLQGSTYFLPGSNDQTGSPVRKTRVPAPSFGGHVPCSLKLRQLGASEDVRKYAKYNSTLWLFNIAMENGPFIDGLPMFTY